MSTLIILRGLPASGKTTWAKQWAAEETPSRPRAIVSLDDIRLMLAGSPQRRSEFYRSERVGEFNTIVARIARQSIATLLDAGWDVAVDAQHAHIEYLESLLTLAEEHHAGWRTQDFDVPLSELLSRNATRSDDDYVDPSYIATQWSRCHETMFLPVRPCPEALR